MAATQRESYSTDVGSTSTLFASGNDSQDVIKQENSPVLAALPDPEAVVYDCPFDRLDCRTTFDNFEEWYNHSLNHFEKGSGERVCPPTMNHCPFCGEKFMALDGNRSWRLKMQHVKTHH